MVRLLGFLLVLSLATYGIIWLNAVPGDVSMTVGGLQVLPTFGAKPMVGLNPISVAVGAGDEPPFVFDASMSSVFMTMLS